MTTEQTPMSGADLDRMARELSNWGRWGDDDERGALNLITPEKRQRAAALVREGVAVSCAHELATEAAPDNERPVQHHMLRGGDLLREGERFGGSADYFAIAPHGFANTHLDALCHQFIDGKMYNGFEHTEVRTDGAHRGSIMAAADGVVGRGVLLDIPVLRGVPWLRPRRSDEVGALPDHVTRADLEAAEERQGVRVEEGDILLVSTGRDALREAEGRQPMRRGLPGLHVDALPWLHERGVAVLGCDGISDSSNAGVPGWNSPIHHIAIVAMGVHLIDNMRLDRLALACAERERWEFLLTIAPLRLARGTASPVNPIALF